MRVCLFVLMAVVAGQAAAGEKYDYAIVVSEATYGDLAWRPAVDALKEKHGGVVLRYAEDVGEVLDSLKDVFAKYTCFVCTSEEATRDFVGQVHRLTRRLDDDPYGDTIWGIVTGYDAADAVRIAKHSEPLVVRRALCPTVGAQLGSYDEGRMFNELAANQMWEKVAGGEQTAKSCATDTTKAIVDSLVDYKPDVFITSGHATERNWMIGFSYRNGFFKCKNGQWYGEDTQKNRFDIDSPNPKVFLGIGNCLIGHIPDRECMALAMMRTGGFYQFVGYTIPTGYGYGGWGVKDYFSELQAGRFTLAEANYVNNQALVYELEKRGLNNDKKFRGGPRGDRDVVVLYGDPAWEAKMPERQLPWSQELSESDGIYTFTMTANERGDWDNRPVVHLLDHRICDVKVIEGSDPGAVITDNFILVPLNKGLLPMKGNRGEDIPIEGDFEKGQQFRIVFKAEQISP